MKRGLIFLLLINCFASAAQSRKKQIESLSYSIDSLNLVIESERISNQQKVSEFEIKASDLNSEMSRLWNDIKALNQVNINFKKEIMLMVEEKNKQDELLQTKIKQIEEVTILLDKTMDSLKSLSQELVIIKTKVIQQNNSKPNNSKINKSNNNFKSVKIGKQVWMTENLNVSTFRNGDPITEVKTIDEWEKAVREKRPAFSYYTGLSTVPYDQLNSNPGGSFTDNKDGKNYGKLYNWYAISDPRGLAPEGWHIPVDSEWIELTNYLGGKLVAGLKLKQKEIITKTKIKKSRKVGGYEETNYTRCSNCKVASDEYKKICPVCKGTGGKWVKTGKYIPEKTEIYYEEIENKSGWNGTNESGFSAMPVSTNGNSVSFWGTCSQQEDENYWCTDICPSSFSLNVSAETSVGCFYYNDPPDIGEEDARKKYYSDLKNTRVEYYKPVRCIKD